MSRIEVPGDKPYGVLVGRDLFGELPGLVAGADQAAVVHTSSVRATAERVRAELERAGVTVLPVEVPDAEAAKDLAVAGRCWDALGGAHFTRTDVVVGVG